MNLGCRKPSDTAIKAGYELSDSSLDAARASIENVAEKDSRHHAMQGQGAFPEVDEGPQAF